MYREPVPPKDPNVAERPVRPAVLFNGAVRPLGRGQQLQNLMDARRQQQMEQNVKATLFAEKQKQKEDEKREKKIAQWEKMSGRGPGHTLGGTEDRAGYVQFDGGAELARQEAMEAARWKMQREHDARAAQLVLRDPENGGLTQEEKKRQEREEAKRQKRIADWERMNPGEAGGHRLGHYSRPGAVEARPEPLVAVRGGRQSERGPPAMPNQSQLLNGQRAAVTQETAPAAVEPEQGGAAGLAYQEAMKVARLKMQREQDSRAAQLVLKDPKNTCVSQEQKKAQEREEAKRKKRIADWERMNPEEAGGHRLGHSSGPVAAEAAPDPCVVPRGSGQFERGSPAVTTQSQPVISQRAVETKLQEPAPAAVEPEQDADDGWEISEEAKRAAMRAARLRMQRSLDETVAKQQDKQGSSGQQQDSSEKQQMTPPQPKLGRLAAKFDKMHL